MSHTDSRQTATEQAPAPQVAPPLPAIDSTQLLAGRKQVAISHGGELYSLRLTRNGKLILTK